MILAGVEVMSYDTLKRVVADVSYKPGWEITVEARPEGPMVRIEAHVEDSQGPGYTVLGINTYPSPDNLTSVTPFLDWLSWRLGRVELHEKDEWFKVGGKVYRDPHAEERAI